MSFNFFSIMAMCKQCGIEKLSNEFPPVTVSDECDHPPLACLRVCTTNAFCPNSQNYLEPCKVK